MTCIAASCTARNLTPGFAAANAASAASRTVS